MIHEKLPTYEHDYTEESDTHFRPLAKSLPTTHISLTLDMVLTPIGMKTLLIRINWSTEMLTINLMVKLEVTTSLRIQMYQTHFDMH